MLSEDSNLLAVKSSSIEPPIVAQSRSNRSANETANSFRKPRLDITDDGSTYSKTIELIKPKINQDMTHTSNGAAEFNSGVGSLSNATSDNCDLHNGTVSNTNSSKCQESSSVPQNTRKPIFRCRESAFFTKLVRRLSKRRTVSKTFPPPPPLENSNISSPLGNVTQTSTATPASRRIRRWFSKHLLPQQTKVDALPPRSIPDAVTRSSTAPRVASDAVYDMSKLPEGTAVRTVATVEYGSVPTVRRGLPPGAPTFSESSLLTSSENAISQTTPSFSTEALCSGLTSVPTDSLLRAHESVSSTHLGTKRQNSTESAVPAPPGTSRYLNVSLAAFGYTGHNRKWVSAQALKVDKPDFLERFKSVSPPPSSSSTAATGGLSSRANRPQHLNLSLGTAAPETARTHPEQLPLARIPSSAPEESTAIIIRKESNADAADDSEPSEVLNGHTDDFSSPHPRIDSGDQSRVRLRLKKGTSSVVDAEQERRSLIMLAVAHNSPRSHSNSTSGGVLSPPLTPVARSTALSPGCLPTSPAHPNSPLFPGRKIGNEEVPTVNGAPSIMHSSELEKVEESPQKEEAEADTPKAEPSAAPVELVCNGHSQAAVNGGGGGATKDTLSRTEPEVTAQLDGHHFLRLVDELTIQLTEKVNEIEADLLTPGLSDEVAGQLRTTVGKVKLLISQKFEQFRGLCEDSIAQQESAAAAATNGTEGAASAKGEGSIFITLPSDLEGFWAMVLLQVDDVRAMIEKSEALRRNGWVLPSVSAAASLRQPGPTSKNGHPERVPSRRPEAKSATPKSARSTRSNKDAELARIQARERIKAAKREFAARQGLNSATDADATASPGFVVF